MNRKGVLTVVSGFSGAGKGTIMKELVKKYPYQLSISATTRNPRQGEEDGREYFFLTREAFESMIEKDQLIEWAEYVGNYYGTPKKYVQQKLDQGEDVILEIEMQGALKVKAKFPEALLIFISIPNAGELKRRLIGRGTEDLDVIKKRLWKACDEASFMKYYDYIIVNDVLEEAVENLNQIIQSEPYRVSKQSGFMKKMSEGLNALKEGDN